MAIKKIQLWLLGTLIFLIPSNAFIKFAVDSAYVNGILVDYLIPKIYLSDMMVLGLLASWCVVTKKNMNDAGLLHQKLHERLQIRSWEKESAIITIIALIGAALIVRQLFTLYPLSAFWQLVKFVEMAMVFIFLTVNHSLLRHKIVTLSVVVATLLQSVVGLFQFIFQRSVGGFWFLGETNISSYFGLAKIVVRGAEKVEPYGTTAHPNILAGILAVYSLVIIASFQKHHSKNKNANVLQLIKVITLSLALLTMLLTGSASAWLTFLVGLAVLLFRSGVKKQWLLLSAFVIFIGTPVLLSAAAHNDTATTSVNRRAYLQQKSVALFFQRPVFGIGLNQFTTDNSRRANITKDTFRQPVHHVGLLWITETGILGISFLLLLLRGRKMIHYSLPLLVLAPIASLDHYLLTLQSGLLLGMFALARFSRE